MIVPICGSARIYRWKEICCEGSSGVEKKSYSFSLYFYMFHAMELFDKIRKILRLSTYHHELQWKTG